MAQPTNTQPQSSVSRQHKAVSAMLAALDLCQLSQLGRAEGLRSALDSGFDRHFQNNTLDLSVLHNALMQQPGISEEQAALPCLVFVLSQDRSEFQVKLPDRVQSLASFDQLLEKAEQLRRLGGDKGKGGALGKASPPPGQDPRAGFSVSAPATDIQMIKSKTDQPARKPAPITPAKTAAVLVTLALAIAALALSTYWVYGRKATFFDLAPVKSTLEISQGMSKGNTFRGFITDPRWPGWNPTAKKAAALEVFRRFQGRGFSRMLLSSKAHWAEVVVQLGNSGIPSVLLSDELDKKSIQ